MDVFDEKFMIGHTVSGHEVLMLPPSVWLKAKELSRELLIATHQTKEHQI